MSASAAQVKTLPTRRTKIHTANNFRGPDLFPHKIVKEPSSTNCVSPISSAKTGGWFVGYGKIPCVRARLRANRGINERQGQGDVAYDRGGLGRARPAYPS